MPDVLRENDKAELRFEGEHCNDQGVLQSLLEQLKLTFFIHHANGECYEIDSLGIEFSVPQCSEDSIVLCLVQYSGCKMLLASSAVVLTESRP